jgi:hypothetical protein
MRPALIEHLPQLGPHLRPLEQQVELRAGDEAAVDQHLPERDVRRRRLLASSASWRSVAVIRRR